MVICISQGLGLLIGLYITSNSINIHLRPFFQSNPFIKTQMHCDKLLAGLHWTHLRLVLKNGYTHLLALSFQIYSVQGLPYNIPQKHNDLMVGFYGGSIFLTHSPKLTSDWLIYKIIYKAKLMNEKRFKKI